MTVLRSSPQKPVDAPIFDPTLVMDRLLRCPDYGVTPLRSLEIDSTPLLIKDERERLGLGSFKALGGAYAVLRMIEENNEDLPLTFVTASAGNHGISVAAGARLFGAKARIFLSATVPAGFETRLKSEGAEVVRAGADYEASVSFAIEDSERNGSVHLADGSWPGYTEPPRLVMEGYTVIAEELKESFTDSGAWPDVVYLQAGVGGFAAAIAQRIRMSWAVQPRIVLVEPEAAPCLKESCAAGQILTVEGPVSTMGRLDCKTPSLLAYQILKDAVDEFAVVSDEAAQSATDLLAARDLPATPSSAAGLAAWIAADRPQNSLIFLTEGPEDA
jgi:diaminopropionate ammonia-lyase